MTRPIIGLTTYRQRSQSGVWDLEASFLPAEYFDAVNRAGGIAVLLPPQAVDADSAEAVVAGLDGLVICGGRDVNPGAYGAEPHPTTDKPDLARDALELALYDAAIAHGVPFLGICRGQQVLNVHQGGTLIQHLPDVVGSDKYQLGGGNYSTAEVQVVPDSLLARSVPGSSSLNVALYHHQAIDEVAPSLTVSARTADGVIEAVEMATKPFAVAVQWHPEETPEDLRLFVGLVEAARAYRSKA